MLKVQYFALIANFVRHLWNYPEDTGNSCRPRALSPCLLSSICILGNFQDGRENYQVNLILLSFVEIKVSLTGLSKFKEGVSKIRELLSLRKGISLHLQEIKIDYPRKRKGNHFWQWKQTIELDSKGNHQWSGENGSNGRLKDKSYNFQGERNFISFQ